MNKKVLIIRFNSIGDIVLTSPTVKALAENNYEVHYLVKKAYASLLIPNPSISKVWKLEDNLSDVINKLKQEKFDVVVDLHNNLRSNRVKLALKTKVYTFKKPRIKYWLLTKLGIRSKPESHIVSRFLKVVEPLVRQSESYNLEYYFKAPLNEKFHSSLPDRYIAIAVGTAFKTKDIPIEKLIDVINATNKEVVLIGGPIDEINANFIQKSVNRKIYNKVGNLSIDDSAHIIKNCEVLISGDTGMMHIGAALSVPMVNVFGSTHPILGYTPFYGSNNDLSTLIQIENLKCRPCTKQGKNKCPKGHFKCMVDIPSSKIISALPK